MEVLVKDAQHVVVGDGGVLAQAGVVVGDQAHVHVVHAQLAGEPCLGVLRHVHHRPAHLLEPLALSGGREARPLDGDDGPAVVHRNAQLAAFLDGDLAHGLAVGVSCGEVLHAQPQVMREERVGTTLGPVHKLVADHKVAGVDVKREGPHRARPNDLLHAQLVHAPEVGAIVDLAGGKGVLVTVAGEKRDLATPDGSHGVDVGGLAPARVKGDLLVVALEEAVEARSAKDTNLCLRKFCHA